RTVTSCVLAGWACGVRPASGVGRVGGNELECLSYLARSDAERNGDLGYVNTGGGHRCGGLPGERERAFQRSSRRSRARLRSGRRRRNSRVVGPTLGCEADAGGDAKGDAVGGGAASSAGWAIVGSAEAGGA